MAEFARLVGGEHLELGGYLGKEKGRQLLLTTSRVHGRDDWIRTSGLTVPKKFQRSKIGFTVLAVKSLFGV
jgi:hypothetical protein